jgi:hypothetical protein
MDISPESLMDLQSRIGEWLAGQPQMDSLEELEQLAVQVSRCAGQAVVEHGISTVDETRGHRKSSLPCDCGRKSKFINYRPRWVGTLFGAVQVERAYYYCKHCRTGHSPWDKEQGVDALMWSPTVKFVSAQTAGRLPYGEAVRLLEELTGLRLEESVVERIVAQLGGRLRAEDAEAMAGYDCGQITPLVPEAPDRLYVGMDGTCAHIDGGHHEVKTGVVYTAIRGPDGVDQTANARYVAAQEPAEQFGHRLYVTAAEAGAELADQLIVIGDGAEWIWNLSAHHYPRAIEIVDFWHACEHIHALARDYYGEDNPGGKRWAKDHCRWLKQRGPGTLLRSLKRMKPKTDQQREAVRRELGYFTTHRQRMRYPQFREAGLMIGSGPVEAACKTVVGSRLKGTGMHWCHAGADAILAIRTALISGDDDRVRRMAKAA